MWWLNFGAVVLFAALLAIFIVSADGLAVGADTPAEPFYGDVGADNVHYEAVQSLAYDGLFSGTDTACREGVLSITPPEFCSDQPLKRWQMAVWIVRLVDGADPVPTAEGSRFVDVDEKHSWQPHVDRLSELGITGGCGKAPLRFCPDENVSREQMATFLLRTFDELPEADTAGFEDVATANVHADAINRLYAAKITGGCSVEPLLYCPQGEVKKDQGASFLYRAITWQKQAEEETITVADPADLPQNISMRSVIYGRAYAESNILIEWEKPDNADENWSYILQWRLENEDSYKSEQVILAENDPQDLDQSSDKFSIDLPDWNTYAFQIVTVDGSGKKRAVQEVISPYSGAAFARRLKSEFVDVYEDNDYKENYPWIKHTWDYMEKTHRSTGNFFRIMPKDIRIYASAIVWRSHEYLDNGLRHRWQATSLNVLHDYITNPKKSVGATLFSHELAHVYTLTNDLLEDPVPIAIAHLHIQNFININGKDKQKNGDKCKNSSSEMLAEVFQDLAGSNGGYNYWIRGCIGYGYGSPPEETLQVVREAVFEGKIPQWFYDTFQQSDGSLDLDAVWELVRSMRQYDRQTVIYQLKDAFGGYCNTETVYYSTSGNPWRDGGCTTP